MPISVSSWTWDQMPATPLERTVCPVQLSEWNPDTGNLVSHIPLLSNQLPTKTGALRTKQDKTDFKFCLWQSYLLLQEDIEVFSREKTPDTKEAFLFNCYGERKSKNAFRRVNPFIVTGRSSVCVCAHTHICIAVCYKHVCTQVYVHVESRRKPLASPLVSFCLN